MVETSREQALPRSLREIPNPSLREVVPLANKSWLTTPGIDVNGEREGHFRGI